MATPAPKSIPFTYHLASAGSHKAGAVEFGIYSIILYQLPSNIFGVAIVLSQYLYTLPPAAAGQ